MIGLELEVKYSNDLRQAQAIRDRMIPLTEIAHALAVSIRQRVREAGRDHRGQAWSPLPGRTTYTTRTGQERASYWLAGPRYPRAAGALWSTPDGRTAYPSRRAYQRAAHGTARRTMVATGDLWRSLRVQVSGPTRIKIAFYGSGRTASGGRVSNKIKARHAGGGESASFLTPSRAEIQAVQGWVRAFVAPAVLQRLQVDRRELAALKGERRTLNALRRALRVSGATV